MIGLNIERNNDDLTRHMVIREPHDCTIDQDQSNLLLNGTKAEKEDDPKLQKNPQLSYF